MLTKIAELEPMHELQDSITVTTLMNPTRLNLEVGGVQNSVLSSCPEMWQVIRNSWILPAEENLQIHGIKGRFGHTNPIQFTGYLAQLFDEGKYWQLTEQNAKLLFAVSKDHQVEIKNHAVWSDSQKLFDLPTDGIPGKWYETVDLMVRLSKDFHGCLAVQGNNHTIAQLPNWSGKNLVLQADNDTVLTVDEVGLNEGHIYANHGSKITIEKLDSDLLDITVGKDSIVDIKAGRVKRLTKNVFDGGRLIVSANILQYDSGSIMPIVKETPRGAVEEFPKYGNFDLKSP